MEGAAVRKVPGGGPQGSSLTLFGSRFSPRKAAVRQTRSVCRCFMSCGGFSVRKAVESIGSKPGA